VGWKIASASTIGLLLISCCPSVHRTLVDTSSLSYSSKVNADRRISRPQPRPYRYLIDQAGQLRLDAARIRASRLQTASNETANDSPAAAARRADIHFFTYATEDMGATRERIVIEAECSGWFASARAFAPGDVPARFRSELEEVLRLERGGGYWIWKFPLLERMLAAVPAGDYILYADAGCWIHHPRGARRLREWVRLLEASPEHDFLVLQLPPLAYSEDMWTSERIFQAYNISADDMDIRHSGQLVGGIKLIRNGANAREMVANVYDLLRKDPFLLTDKYNNETEVLRQQIGITDRPFVENRHDQSITSILSKLYGSVIIPDETWPAAMNKTAPILAAREKKLGKAGLDKMRQWKERDQCHGPNPLRLPPLLRRRD
jgi:hypothetical protein